MHKCFFGPLTPSFNANLLHQSRQRGETVVFGESAPVDLTTTITSDWNGLLARAGGDFHPDFIALWLPMAVVPPALWQAPVPIVGLAPFWDLHFHWYRQVAQRCDLLLTDQPGVDNLQREGIADARPANLHGLNRAFIDGPWLERPRDIDVLFVGDLHPAVKRERLAWLGRLSALGKHCNVLIGTAVPDKDYRELLSRSKIVFNFSARSVCNRRVFEAIAGGALLLQDAANAEVAALLKPGVEYATFDERNLESIVKYYLGHEEERRKLTEAARSRLEHFTFERFWQQALETIESHRELLQLCMASRLAKPMVLEPVAAIWSAMSGGGVHELVEAVKQSKANPDLAIAAGVFAAEPEESLRWFEGALQVDPFHPIAGLNAAETLVALKRNEDAVAMAHQTLATLELNDDRDFEGVIAPHYPQGIDLFRVEWERAAWMNAGDPDGERGAKRQLVRYRLHSLLADLTNDLGHFAQAALARPDLAIGRAAFGCALARAGRFPEAIAELRAALWADPFDRAAAKALHQAYGDAGDLIGRRSIEVEQALLSRATRGFIAPEEWFAGAIPSPAMPKAKHTCRISWQGDFRAVHSLAHVNRQLAVHLAQRGHDLSLSPTDTPELVSKAVTLPDSVETCIGKSLADGPQVVVGHRWPPITQPPATGHWVVMQPWEYGPIPETWQSWLEQVDEVWAPSRFVRAGFIAGGVPEERVHVVPLGVDPDRFRPDAPPFPLQTTKRCKFLFVGGTIFRKGFDLLLETYARTFDASDNVCLVVKDMGVGTFYQGQTAGERIAAFSAKSDAPAIEYIDRDLSDEDMAGLYTACDCLVLPYRGEGFALPVLEAMASGRPAIVTGFGPALEYCDPDTAYLLPAILAPFPKEPLKDLAPREDAILAEPSRAALAKYMRQIAAQPEKARTKGIAAAAFVKKYFTWEHSVARIEERLSVLQKRPVRRLKQVQPTGARPRVSLCMIVRNEEKNLPDCLGPLRGLFDETIIVDSGSTDRTRELAKALGAKVFESPWQDSFSAARNESLKHAAGEWIFWLDADDRIDADNLAKLKELLANLPDDNVAYVMKCLCVPGTQGGTATVVDHIRLFRNRPEHRFTYRVHEQILPAIRETHGKDVHCPVVITHLGYADPKLRRRKLDRDLRLLHMELREQPDDPFTLFNVGSIYHELGRPADAIGLLERSLEKSNPGASIVRKLYALIAQCHQELRQPDEALRVCREVRHFYPKDVELLLLESNLLRDRGDLKGAEACLRECIHGEEDEHFASVSAGLRSFRARHNLAMLYLKQKRYGEAEAQWRAALVEESGYFPAYLGLSEVYLETKDWSNLEKLAGEMERFGATGVEEADLLLGRAKLLRGEFSAARFHFGMSIQKHPRSIQARLLLSRALLQENIDLSAAEKALKDVLAFDPSNREVIHNLAVLMQKKK